MPAQNAISGQAMATDL